MTGGYTTQFRTLFTELQRYVSLQKRYLALDTAEKLVALLSTVAVVLVLVMDWTEMGAPPPMATLPICICRVFFLSNTF